MDILILIAVIATGASGLYGAYTFKTYTERRVVPLIQRITKAANEQIEATGKDLVTSQDLSKQLRTITTELRQDRDALTHLADRIDTQQDQFGRDLVNTDRRVAQLGESLGQLDRSVEQLGRSVDRQGAQLTAIYSHAKSQGQPTRISQKTDQLVLAMLEAESHMDRQGWGVKPHLYALTKKIQPEPADHELPAERPDVLVPAVQQPLSDGDPLEALTSTRWPEDVAGCVLVAELSDLPAGSYDGEPVDPVAAGQWTSTRPDGRPARLAVAVRRNGEHVCALRVKGDYDVQIRTGRAAGKIVTALFGTF